MSSKRSYQYGSFATICLATVIHIIAFATPGWIGDINDRSAYMGLWLLCSYSTCISYAPSAMMAAVRAMETIALIAFLVSCGCGVGFLVNRKNDIMRQVMAYLAIIAGVFAMIGVIVYGATTMYYLFYSFGLCIVGALFGFIGGVLGLLAKEWIQPPSSQQYPMGSAPSGVPNNPPNTVVYYTTQPTGLVQASEPYHAQQTGLTYAPAPYHAQPTGLVFASAPYSVQPTGPHQTSPPPYPDGGTPYEKGAFNDGYYGGN